MSELPRGWTCVPIGAIVSLNPKNECEDRTEVGFVPMSLLGTRYRDQIRYERRVWGDVKKGYTHFADGDVLLAKITPCFENGKAGIARALPNGLGAGSTEFLVSRPNPKVALSEYLLAFLKTPDFLRVGESEMTGTVGQKRLPKDYLLQTEIPLAPLAEQKRIADKLDALLARVDACRERLDRVPRLLKRFRQAVLAAATSGALTNSDLADWKFERAEDVCAKVQSGGTPREGFTDIKDVPFIKVYNIVAQQIDFEYRPQFVTSEVNETSLAKSKTYPGDVLMNIVGPPLGKVAIVPDAHPVWNINQAITLFRPSDRVCGKWLYYFFCSGISVAEVLHETRGTVGQVNISLSQCRRFIIPVPPLQEQAEIVRRVEALFALADRIEARYRAARAQVDKLTPALLAKAFRGELVPQDPNDEPASALLARIRAEREGQGQLFGEAGVRRRGRKSG